MALAIRRLGYALGAEVDGFDLRVAPDDAAIAGIRDAMLEHLVLCFPRQSLDRAALHAFARRFGELEVVRSDHSDDVARNVEFLTNQPVGGKPWDGFKPGEYWHTDESFGPRPTGAAFLFASEIPPAGGDTMFANMYLAYDTLSPAMQRIAERLELIHDHPASRRNRTESIPAVQPLVRVHPETGRKALYSSARGKRVRGIAGMTDEESAPLLDFFNEHAVRYEHTYRHRWETGDLLVWDNRCLMHFAVSDYDLGRDIRHMVRTAVIGEPSGHAL